MMRNSRAANPNPKIKEWTDYLKKTNMTFFANALAALSKDNMGNGGLMVIGFIGSRDLPGVTVRQAQSVLRWDMRPSLWSRAFVIAEKIRRGATGVGKVKILNISLD